LKKAPCEEEFGTDIMDGHKLFAKSGHRTITELKRPGNGGAFHFRKPQNTKGSKLISIIIPAHNEEDYIGLTLDAINRQSYPHFEIIVVANGCTDRTPAVALNNCHRLVVLSNKCLGVARNLGAKLAKGDLLLFLDADTLLEPHALETIAKKFTRQCAAGTLKGRPDSQRFSHKLIYFVKNFLHLSSIHHGSAGTIVCWKKDFVATRGFDERLQVRENSDLINRLEHHGRYKYIRETAATTSMRRYEHAGTKKIVFLWFKLWLQSLFSDLHHKNYETIR
jgi:glycosyltransferase involved in cell wall biosynthesis